MPKPSSCCISDQTNSFVRAKAELELAQYMLKSDGLMLHPEFLQRLRALPLTYVYGEYRQIYRDYGTHYITEAALGGQYDFTIILNKERLENSGTGADLSTSFNNKEKLKEDENTGVLNEPLLQQKKNVFTCINPFIGVFSRLFFGRLQALHTGRPEDRGQHTGRLCFIRRSRWILQWLAE